MRITREHVHSALSCVCAFGRLMCTFTFCVYFRHAQAGLSVGVWLGACVHTCACVCLCVPASWLTCERCFTFECGLRCRDVSNTGITALPDSIGNCRRLQFL